MPISKLNKLNNNEKLAQYIFSHLMLHPPD